MKKGITIVLSILVTLALFGCSKPKLVQETYTGKIVEMNDETLLLKLNDESTTEELLFTSNIEKPYDLRIGDEITVDVEFYESDEALHKITKLELTENNLPRYEADYPRNYSGFALSNLKTGAAPSKGTMTVMVIPVVWTDGCDIDDEFTKQVNNCFDSEIENDITSIGIKKYYERASYGLLEFELTIMEPYSTGKSYSETHNSINVFTSSDILLDAYRYTMNNSNIDISKYDINSDGFIDEVLFIHNNASESGRINAVWFDEEYLDLTADLPLRIATYAEAFYPYSIGSDEFRRPSIEHEMAHTMGVSDYYDYSGKQSLIGRFDLQEGTYGDFNAFTKYEVGWINPYVIYDNVESVTLKLGCSAENPDAILIPSSAGWNGTPFDEYLFIDVMGPRGNYQANWESLTSKSKVNVDGGVRILHVNSEFGYVEANGTIIKFDYDKHDVTLGKALRSFNNNSSSSKYNFLRMIPCHGSITTDYSFNTEWLFGPGDEFTMEKYASCFANGDTLDNGGTIPYSITIDYFDPVKTEAIVTITRIAD